MEQIKKRQIELLKLGFERNDDQQSWISFKYDQNWYVDFFKVRDFNEEKWADCIESIKRAYIRGKNRIEWSELYLLGVKSAEKRIKQKIKDSLNMYKSRLREETYPKLTKTIKKDKVRELEIRIETLNKLL
jgi:hypothetical protein